MPERLKPDFHTAALFLKLLAKNKERCVFQTWDDEKEKKGYEDPELGKAFFGSLERHYHKLVELNRKGAGIGVRINTFDGKGGALENVIKVKAVFVDTDGAPLEPICENLTSPHIIVQSSPGKWHVYWLVKDIPLNRFTPLQLALVDRFGTDHQIAHLNTVMRLPGFLHNKQDPFFVFIKDDYDEHAPLHCEEDLIRGLSLQFRPLHLVRPPVEPTLNGVPQGQRDSEIFRFACSMKARGFKRDDVERMVKAKAADCNPPFPEKEALRKVEQAFKYEDDKQETGEGLQPSERKQKIKQAMIGDYHQLLVDVLGELRRDIFTGNLMCFDKQKQKWLPAITQLPRIESKAAELEDLGFKKFRRTLIEPHFKALEHKMIMRLIPDVPPWDGRDRIKEIAEALVLDGTQAGFDNAVCEDLIKMWMAGIFRRLTNPDYQNRCLIFLGPQGIGKDYLVTQLVGGFGQWQSYLTISRNEKDNLEQLSKKAVLRIAEFESTSKAEVSAIKHMITADHTDIREAYGRAAVWRSCRHSFVANCNFHDIFRDPTGHRRYIVIALADIERGAYPDGPANQLQVLAQAKSLAVTGYEAAEYSENRLQEYLKDKTPASVEEEIADGWEQVVADFLNDELEDPVKNCELKELQNKIRADGFMTNTVIGAYSLMFKLSRMTGVSERYCRQKLRLLGYAYRNTDSRGFWLKPVISDRRKTDNEGRPVIVN